MEIEITKTMTDGCTYTTNTIVFLKNLYKELLFFYYNV